MKRIGLVVAVEVEAVLEKFGTAAKQEKIGTMEVLIYDMKAYELVLIHCGAGEIAAAAGTQLLISLYHVDAVVNYGVVGGLTQEMALNKTCIVEKIVHYDFDTSALDPVEPGRYTELPDIYIPVDAELLRKALEIEPGLKKVVDASADKFVAGEANKSRLHELYGADICEMEAAGIALTCHRNQVPCLLIKCVSDAITGGGEEFTREVLNSSRTCIEIVDRIMRSL